jgi:tellurite resistance protein TehA-like permease
MGATTLINVSVRTIYQDYGFGGKSFLYAMWGLWWVDVAISCLCVWGMAQIMYASLFTENIFTRANTCLEHTRFTRQRHSLETMLPVWLLPIVTFVVAASSGGILVGPLQEFSPSHALITVMVSIFMVTIGLSLSFMILTIYFLRLMVHGLPEGKTVLSAFLPLGPAGQGGYATLLIGSSLKSLLPLTYGKSEILRASATGDTINVICLCMAIMLWSFATMWIIYALLVVLEVARKSQIPFNLSFWGLIFPNGPSFPSTWFLWITSLLRAPFYRCLCQSVCSAISNARFTILPRLWCDMFRADLVTVDRCQHLHNHARTNSTNFPGSMLGRCG